MSPTFDNKPEPDPTDGRSVGDWQSRYPKAAWVQIALELIYLLVLLGLSVAGLFAIGCALSEENLSKQPSAFFGQTLHSDMLRWIAVGLSGCIGGVVFDLKWLYHSVATCIWNQDRILWRLLVPPVGGLVATFLAFVIFSNVVSLVRGESLRNVFLAWGLVSSLVISPTAR